MKGSLEAVRVYRPLVRDRLLAHIRRFGRGSDPRLGWQTDVAERLMGFATAGKLLRGCLACYSFTLCSGKTRPPAAVLDTAAALELSHAALLIHDDIIDQDDLRRGQPAMHRQYRRLFMGEAAVHLGDSLALVAGDMTLLLAFDLLGDVGEPLGSLLARELVTVCAGQMQDAYMAGASRQPTKREIYALMEAKSAGYSVAFPLKAGAVLAGQAAVTQRRWYVFGLTVGTMFQIRDDELGIFGNATKLGKPVGADIREGKKTLLHYYWWQAAGAAERRQLGVIFGNPKASKADIAAAQQAMRRHDIPGRLQRDLDRLERRAARQIDRLDVTPVGRKELRQLIAFCAQREA
jgi:geranylgeranyl diphosphate synthase, type I